MIAGLLWLAALLAAPARASGGAAPVAPTRIGSTRLETVSASVSLAGQASGLRPGEPRAIVMQGLADFRGDDGLASGPTSIAVAALVDGTPGCQNGWASPSLRVLLQRGGRYVAGVVEGTLSVQSCVQDGQARLQARGLLAGEALVDRP